MKYDYDLICIGLGPAGMAVSIMGAEMGLKVCAIEKHKIGGECMNVGCIPSKSLLRISKFRHAALKLQQMDLSEAGLPDVRSPFPKIDNYLSFISDKKTMKMFEKVKLLLNEGEASFVDSHRVKVGDQIISAKRIFIATGTGPMIPPIKGMDEVNTLDNTNIFNLEAVPKSMVIVGGGAIGCEMAQAFSRLGTKCTIVQMDPYLIPNGDRQAGELLEAEFKKEGIEVYNGRTISYVKQVGDEVAVCTADDLCLKGEKLLVAAGRKVSLDGLQLENAGIKYAPQGVKVDQKFRTNKKHIYAVGDCNGGVMLSHAAMHQGMFAVMNAVSPFGMFKFTKYVIPWTVFTEPQVSYVGMREEELKKKRIKYETHTVKYEDYGAAIAENVGVGFVKIHTSSLGRVYGVSIIGEGSGEMINEWAMIIQKKIRLHNVMFLAHSFPTMGFLSKRVSEVWMMKKMESSLIQKVCKFFYRWC